MDGLVKQLLQHPREGITSSGPLSFSRCIYLLSHTYRIQSRLSHSFSLPHYIFALLPVPVVSNPACLRVTVFVSRDVKAGTLPPSSRSFVKSLLMNGLCSGGLSFTVSFGSTSTSAVHVLLPFRVRFRNTFLSKSLLASCSCSFPFHIAHGRTQERSTQACVGANTKTIGQIKFRDVPSRCLLTCEHVL